MQTGTPRSRGSDALWRRRAGGNVAVSGADSNDAIDRGGIAFERLDVVVPVFNEAATLPALLERLRAACPGAALIFVDNGSTDATCALLEAAGDVTLVRHAENLGYGRSLRDGIAAGERPWIVQIDADLEYRPEDIPAVIAELARFEAVYGSRFLGRSGPMPGMSALRRMGNRVVTGLFDRLYGQDLSDLYTGLRAFRREALTAACHCEGFEYVFEVAARLVRGGGRIGEVAIGYDARETGASKMRHVPEFLKFAYWLVRLRLERPPRRAARG